MLFRLVGEKGDGGFANISDSSGFPAGFVYFTLFQRITCLRKNAY